MVDARSDDLKEAASSVARVTNCVPVMTLVISKGKGSGKGCDRIAIVGDSSVNTEY